MSNFTQLKQAVEEQFTLMAATSTLFEVAFDKDELYALYLASFREGDNPVYRERTEHDCSCCRSYIKNGGGVVSIFNGQLQTIWDVKTDEVYQPVADALAAFIKSKAIKNLFLHTEPQLGTDFNFELLEDNSQKKWNHFYFKLPSKYVVSKTDVGTQLGNYRSSFDVLKRGLSEITMEAIDTVLELIEQGSLYRGSEHKGAIAKFKKNKKAYDKATNKDTYCWEVVANRITETRFRNSVIGTLMVDLSEGRSLDDAVKMFESKVAPQNYKRPTALITKGMIEQAQKKVAELGISESLQRRHATSTDLTINNILYADRNTVKQATDGSLGVFEDMMTEVRPTASQKFEGVEEVSIDTFLKNIVPKATKLELMFDNKYTGNLMSLIAPVNADAPNILKWGNNFSWSYNGEVTDSMKARVTAKGGRVDGVFRFTHSWNELEDNQSLMDLHVFMPGNSHSQGTRSHDNYGTGRRVGWNHRTDNQSRGVQDVDYTDAAPKGYIPVENITFPHLNLMPDGEYICKIHNWSFRNTGGRGKAEIEFDNALYQYTYPATKNKEWVEIARVTKENGEFSINHTLKPSGDSQTLWNIPTQQFHRVTMLMNSPNHWDGEKTGNKHWFFVLENCLNGEKARGLYNEFLKGELNEHRKVFEVLGSKMKVEESDQQLSGLGFSETQRASVICKVSGAFSRVIKINL